MAWADADDIAERWVGQHPPTVEDDTIDVLIGDAEGYIRGEYPNIEDLIDGGIVDEDNVTRVVAQMVIRKLQNPLGIRQQNETTGPFTRGVTFGGDLPGELWSLTDAERVMLGDRSAGRRHGRAFTINPVVM